MTPHEIPSRRLTMLCAADIRTDDPEGMPWDVYYQRADGRAARARDRAERAEARVEALRQEVDDLRFRLGVVTGEREALWEAFERLRKEAG